MIDLKYANSFINELVLRNGWVPRSEEHRDIVTILLIETFKIVRANERELTRQMLNKNLCEREKCERYI